MSTVTVTLRLYAELNDHLPAAERQRPGRYRVRQGLTLRDLLAGLGLPADEVALALVDGEPAALEHVLADGDRVSLYPRVRGLEPPP